MQKRRVAANPQTKPTDLGCESAGKLDNVCLFDVRVTFIARSVDSALKSIEFRASISSCAEIELTTVKGRALSKRNPLLCANRAISNELKASLSSSLGQQSHAASRAWPPNGSAADKT